MKNFYRFTLTICAISFTYSSFAANENLNMSKKWICQTNASSSTNENEKKADDMMSKKSQSATSAFGFALKNCRDCNKITCSVDDTNQ